MKRLLLALLVATLLASGAHAKVVNENVDDLPPGCNAIAGEVALKVKGGRDQATAFPGVVFTFDNRSFDVPPCTKVTVTFENTDDIRHQFMVHGAWPDGFFLLEVDGKGEETGTFITGSQAKSRLVHCGLPQHQQKGMKAQLLVAGGDGTIPNIPGISGLPEEDRPLTAADEAPDMTPRSIPGVGALLAAGLLASAAAARSRR